MCQVSMQANRISTSGASPSVFGLQHLTFAGKLSPWVSFRNCLYDVLIRHEH